MNPAIDIYERLMNPSLYMNPAIDTCELLA